MTDSDVVARIGARVGTLGAAWMARPLMAAGADLGIEGYPWPLYMIGRGGVLGDVDPDELAETVFFPSPAFVTSAWTAGRALLSPAEGVERFIGCGYAWGASAYDGAANLGRVTDLAEQLVDGLECGDARLAAAWREVARPTTSTGRLVRALQVLREHRGGVHAACVRDAGMAPVEAMVATGGEGAAQLYGWTPPFPDADAARARKVPVEAATNERVGACYEALAAAHLAELADLLEALQPAS